MQGEALSDAELETRIHVAYYKALSEWDRESWGELVRLIKQRSPEQVKRMEQRMGLE
jgi:hypothetical protein